MIYPKYYTSVSDDIFNTAYDEQIYSLGDVVLNQNSGSIYVQHLIFAKATFDVIKYQLIYFFFFKYPVIVIMT